MRWGLEGNEDRKMGRNPNTGGTKALEDLLENKKIELVKRL